MKRNSKQSGFTLIELLASLIIIAITATIAMPMFLQSKAEADLDASTAQLVQTLYLAQLKAVNQKTVTKIVLVGGTPTADRTTFYWKPKGHATLVSANTDVFIGLGGFVQSGQNITNYNGVKKFVICNAPRSTATMSRVVTIDRVGRIRQSEILGGCTP